MPRPFLTGLLSAFAAAACYAAGLNWEQKGGYRQAELPLQEGQSPGFKLPTDIGIAFTNLLSDQRAAENQIRLNGSGVAAADMDGDGWCDLYFTGLEAGNKLFRNLGGWKFEDVTEQAGVACHGQYSSGCGFVDVSGDGRVDLLVNSVGGGTRLFLNNGQGGFTEAASSGLLRQFGAASLALGDLDGDGDLDLYVANYRTTTVRTTGFGLLSVGGKYSVQPKDKDQLELMPDGRVLEHGEPDAVYLNDGQGRFTQLSWTAGAFLDEKGLPLTKAPHDWGLAVMIRDLNQDGHADIYVCNDFHSTDKIWLGDGKGKFRALPTLALRNTSTFSMAVDFADLNKDGHDDFFVADMLDPDRRRRMMQFSGIEAAPTAPGDYLTRLQFDRNTLQLNRGDGTYAEIAYYAGLEASGWTWSARFLDVDLDGHEDLLMTTGHMFDTQDLDAAARIDAMGPFSREKIPGKLLLYPRMKSPKAAFRNQGDLTFKPMAREWGFDQLGVSHGMAAADLDNDGDLDVAVNNLNDAAGLYENLTAQPRVRISLKGSGGNPHGIGARIEVQASGLPVQAQEMLGGGRYLSSDDFVRTFAVHSTDTNLLVKVRWPSGKISELRGLKANFAYEIEEGAADVALKTAERLPLEPLFEDVSSKLNHKHAQQIGDEFLRQPLLPNRFSQLGPGISWADSGPGGRPALIIPAGKGSALGVFTWTNGVFQKFNSPALAGPVTRDQPVALGFHWQGQEGVLAAFSNYQDGVAGGMGLRSYGWNTLQALDLAPAFEATIGPVASADFDNDGDLDLFVGGRLKPGSYPEAVDSRIYRHEAGKLVLDARNQGVLKNLGRVSGACWTDLNNDGWADLAVASEWDAPKILINEKGLLVDRSAQLGFSRQRGFWTSVTSGDFNNDGRADLVFGNWGLNTKYRATPTAPRRIYYGDFDQTGRVAVVEAAPEADGKFYPERELNSLSAALPHVLDQFPTHAAYAKADVSALLGARLQSAKIVEATHLETTLFLNRGAAFEPAQLPREAQFSPVFGVAAADFDGDGNLDLFLAQNFFAVQPQSWRSDAGLGLLLLGRGDGSFAPMKPAESGIRIYGEARGAAWADFDGDGRVDLAVSQNNGETKVYRNAASKPGVRVQLRGGAQNPRGIGARVRRAGGAGFSAEVQAGGGYWSQNSATLVFPAMEDGGAFEVKWPAGQTRLHQIPAAAKSVALDVDGGVRALE